MVELMKMTDLTTVNRFPQTPDFRQSRVGDVGSYFFKDKTMNVLAIVGSARKGKATDSLVDRAIEGVKSVCLDCAVNKINLIDYHIEYCRNCLACRDSKTNEPVATCRIRDDMDSLKEELLKSDSLIFGTPVHMGFATALMMTFLERICWTFAKPER